MEAWSQFFIRAGIPSDIAKKYAKAFQNNRITKEMLPELDKSTLSELGVTAIGDQLCILRRIKAAKSAIERGNSDFDDSEDQKSAISPQKVRITAPNSEFSQIPESRRGKPPPDRNEIYHVKMPAGNTARSHQILQKAEKMREQGLAVRGTTGVRQGGRSVSPIDKSSLAARIRRKQSSEVSSTTDRRGTQISRISASSIKKTISNRPTSSNLSSRLTTSSAKSPSMRIHVDSSGNSRKPSRIEGRLQKTSSRNSNSSILLKYDDEVDEEMEYEEEEMILAEEPVYYEETPSVHERITYRHHPTSSSSNSRKPTNSVFNRVSYHR